MLGRIGWSLARVVGLCFALLGGWVLFGNAVVSIAGSRYGEWVLAWVLLSGLAGVSGGVLYLLSIDGPTGLRTRRIRLVGWLLMLGLALLPSSLTQVLISLVLLAIPTLLVGKGAGGPATQVG